MSKMDFQRLKQWCIEALHIKTVVTFLQQFLRCKELTEASGGVHYHFQKRGYGYFLPTTLPTPLRGCVGTLGHAWDFFIVVFVVPWRTRRSWRTRTTLRYKNL